MNPTTTPIIMNRTPPAITVDPSVAAPVAISAIPVSINVTESPKVQKGIFVVVGCVGMCRNV